VLHTRLIHGPTPQTSVSIIKDATGTPDGANINGYEGSAIKIEAGVDNATQIIHLECRVENDHDEWVSADMLTLRCKYVDEGAYVGGRTPDLIAHVLDCTYLVECTNTDIDAQVVPINTFTTYTAGRAATGTMTEGRKFFVKLEFSDLGFTNVTDYQTVYIGEIVLEYTPT